MTKVILSNGCVCVISDTVLQFENFDLETVITPVNLPELRRLLHESEYNSAETEFLLKGFSEGFELGYQGPVDRTNYSRNIPFTVGNKVELWNKIMKEVQARRYAGPFVNPPFDDHFVQSPIGLVPKKKV